MIGILVVCFVLFPVLVFTQTKREKRLKFFFDKEDTDVIKGIAACFVILAHLVLNMKGDNVVISPLLNVFSVTGGMGVLIFFFISGYGIYKGYAHRKLDVYFLKKRLFGVYLPCVLVQLIFVVLEMTLQKEFSIYSLMYYSLFGAWFIDVIMIQYLIFYFSGILAKGKQSILISITFLLSVIIALIFYIGGMNPRWYNGLLLFPIGMLVAWKEQMLIAFMNGKWLVYVFCFSFTFIFWGGVFARGKGSMVGIDIFKVLAGISLCLLICTIYTQLQFHSRVMKYIGNRSLFFYLIHVNLLSIIDEMGVHGICVFYIVLLLTFGITEIIYQLYQRYGKSIKKNR